MVLRLSLRRLENGPVSLLNGIDNDLLKLTP